MYKFDINKDVQLCLPEGYKRTALPGKKEWCEALKSGKYTKTTSTLCWLLDAEKGLYGHCCLGVLSQLQGRLHQRADTDRFVDGIPHAGQEKSGVLEKDNPLVISGAMNTGGGLPKEVEVFVSGLLDTELKSLVELNDADAGEMVSFKDTAKIINLLWYDPDHEQP